MPLIKSTLDSYAATLEKVWAHDRSETIGASEIGQCARKVFWTKNERDPVHRVERDPEYVETWGARMRGTMYEDNFWEPAMRARFGERLLYAGIEQKTFFNDFLSATPDGMVVELSPAERIEIADMAGHGTTVDQIGSEIMVECKTADPRTNLTDPKETNVYQTHVQMGLVRERTPFKPTHSVLSYTDASFWSDVKEFVIPFDPAIYDAAISRAMMTMTASSFREAAPEGWISGGKECLHCPFTHACGIARRDLPFADGDVDPQFAAEITDMAREVKLLEVLRDNSDKRAREMQEQIKNRLREKGVRKIPGVVSWSPVKGRKGYDNKAIQDAAIAAGIDLSPFEKYGEPTDRFVIQIGTQDAP